MFITILISGAISFLVLFGFSLLISILPTNEGFLSFLSLDVSGNITQLLVLALVLGVLNALIVPFVMRLFQRARGIWLFFITLAIDVVVLLILAMFLTALEINWQTAILMALILSWVNPVANVVGSRRSGSSRGGRSRSRR